MTNFVLAGVSVSDSDLQALPSVAFAHLRTQGLFSDSAHDIFRGAAAMNAAGNDSSKTYHKTLHTGARGMPLDDGSMIYVSATDQLEKVLDVFVASLEDEERAQSAAEATGLENLRYVLACLHQMQAGVFGSTQDSASQLRHLEKALQLLVKTRDLASQLRALELTANVRRCRGAPRDWAALCDLHTWHLDLASKLRSRTVEVSLIHLEPSSALVPGFRCPASARLCLVLSV